MIYRSLIIIRKLDTMVGLVMASQFVQQYFWGNHYYKIGIVLSLVY